MKRRRVAAWLLTLMLAAADQWAMAAPSPAASAAASGAASAVPSQDAVPLPGPIPPKPWPSGIKKKPAVHYYNGKLVEDDTPPGIEIASEFQEPGRGKVGELMVPAYLGDLVYMSLMVQTKARTPLKNTAVEIHSQKGNRYALMADRTDQDGYLEFHMLATQPGKDRVKVSAAGVERDFILDVTPFSDSEWLGAIDLKGVTSWDLLMSADVRMGRDQVEARFPAPVQELKDKTIRLAGFMMPLGINEKQTHFLLSAVPPSCFFHPPGGPSSAVEVYADRGIEMADEPMVLEGRFELVDRSEGGLLYRLRNARQAPKGK